MTLFRAVYTILWGDLIKIPLPGGSTLGLSLLVLILETDLSRGDYPEIIHISFSSL
ncbi:hypothetical protein H6B15_10360 [Gemmiger formicilis]|nr:hypothetical protein [Gemmiger formicilis]